MTNLFNILFQTFCLRQNITFIFHTLKLILFIMIKMKQNQLSPNIDIAFFMQETFFKLYLADNFLNIQIKNINGQKTELRIKNNHLQFIHISTNILYDYVYKQYLFSRPKFANRIIQYTKNILIFRFTYPRRSLNIVQIQIEDDFFMKSSQKAIPQNLNSIITLQENVKNKFNQLISHHINILQNKMKAFQNKFQDMQKKLNQYFKERIEGIHQETLQMMKQSIDLNAIGCRQEVQKLALEYKFQIISLKHCVNALNQNSKQFLLKIDDLNHQIYQKINEVEFCLIQRIEKIDEKKIQKMQTAIITNDCQWSSPIKKTQFTLEDSCEVDSVNIFTFLSSRSYKNIEQITEEDIRNKIVIIDQQITK